MTSSEWNVPEGVGEDLPGGFGGADSLEAMAAGDLPAVEEMESALEAAMSVGDDLDLELEMAAVEADLSAEEELAFAEFQGAEPATLEDLLAIIERKPGLKITFSY